MMVRGFLVVILLVGWTLGAIAQNRIGTGEVRTLYRENCMSCHGEGLRGGGGAIGGSLLVDRWEKIPDGQDFLDYVKNGNPDMGMPAYRDALSDAQIRALEIYIDEEAQKAERQGPVVRPEAGGIYRAGGYAFRLETVAEGLDTPWSIVFLPSGGALITERRGTLRLFKDGRLREPVEGTPEVWARGQGGLLEVGIHPDYRENAWVYLGFSESSAGEGNRRRGMTKIVRGRVIDNQWLDEEVVFEVPDRFHNGSGVHFGTRFVFQDDYLFFSIGDRGRQDEAQDLSRPNGKIHRIFQDGRIPPDNPFFGRAGAYPSIWSYGNRNAQGLAAHPETGELWESEHGPRGGDEINRIERGRNYGWPVITHGMNYDGTPITDRTAAPGMEQPKLHWTPSIAVCGMDFYRGDLFPAWKHQLFVGGLASNELHRLVIEDGEVVRDEIILDDAGRVRDVENGPDGYLYLVLNGPGRIARLVPAE